MLGAAGRGFALGVAWGLVARIWMRLISTDPEFSWSGTIAILVLAGIAGLSLGLIHGSRAQGRSRWWLLAVVMVLPLFASPGLPFLPAVFLGGLAFGRRAMIWRVLGGFGFAGSVALLVMFTSSDGGTGLPVAMGYGGFLLLWLALAAGGSVLYRPQAWNREAVVRTSRQARQRRAGWRRAPHPKSSS
jgi:hypothetical protein